MIDGTINHLVNHVMSLPIRLPCLYSFQIEFFVTKLEGTYPIVLGHNWLTQHNPLIDWRKGTIEFNPPEPMDQPTSSRPDLEPQNLPLATSSLSENSPVHSAPGSCANSLSIRHLVENYPSEDQPSNDQTTPNKPQTSLVNAATFMSTWKSKGAISFQITSLPTVVTGLAAQTGEADPEIPGLPKEYQEYRDIFSTQKAKLLLKHRPYDLAIQIEADKIPPLGPIYSLSALELKTLQEFLEENIKTSIICLSKSPCGALVLFVKKKDRTLRLCVDYHSLNRMICKDWYPIPLLNDLLDAPRKAQIYSKIDLKSAYHLVHIAKGDKWKTVFHTRYGSFKWLVMPFGLSNASSAF